MEWFLFSFLNSDLLSRSMTRKTENNQLSHCFPLIRKKKLASKCTHKDPLKEKYMLWNRFPLLLFYFKKASNLFGQSQAANANMRNVPESGQHPAFNSSTSFLHSFWQERRKTSHKLIISRRINFTEITFV